MKAKIHSKVPFRFLAHRFGPLPRMRVEKPGQQFETWRGRSHARCGISAKTFGELNSLARGLHREPAYRSEPTIEGNQPSEWSLG